MDACTCGVVGWYELEQLYKLLQTLPTFIYWMSSG